MPRPKRKHADLALQAQRLLLRRTTAKGAAADLKLMKMEKFAAIDVASGPMLGYGYRALQVLPTVVPCTQSIHPSLSTLYNHVVLTETWHSTE